MLALADAVVVGPGLGRSEWASGLWHRSLETNLPLIVDADALNLLAGSPRAAGPLDPDSASGEAARLLGKATADVQLDRLGSVRELAGRYDAVAILKGAGTLIAQAGSERAQVCDRGNPGMATAGMGDVLAGVLGALVVQGNDLARARVCRRTAARPGRRRGGRRRRARNARLRSLRAA